MQLEQLRALPGYINLHRETPSPLTEVLPTLSPGELDKLHDLLPRIYDENNMNVNRGEPDILGDSAGNTLFLFDNPARTRAYMKRAEQSPDAPPKKGTKSLHSFPPKEYVGYVPELDVILGMNAGPYCNRSLLCFPNYAKDGQSYFERPQHPYALRPEDLACMQELNRAGFAAFAVLSSPSIQHLHYHGIPDSFYGQPLPLVRAIRSGDFSQNSVRIIRGTGSHKPDIHYPCSIHTDPDEALHTLRGMTDEGTIADIFSIDGHFVLLPVQGYKIELPGERLDPSDAVTWYRPLRHFWMPSGERLGILLKNPHLEIDGDAVKINETTYSLEDYMYHFYRSMALQAKRRMGRLEARATTGVAWSRPHTHFKAPLSEQADKSHHLRLELHLDHPGYS